MVILIVFAALVLAIGAGAFRFSRALNPRQRVVFRVVAALAIAYVAPRAFRGAVVAYGTGAEIRQQQGR